MAVLVVLACATLPLISSQIIEPYIVSLYALTPGVDYSIAGITDDNLWIASIVMVFIVIVLFAGLGKGKARKVDVYMSGISLNNDERTFRSSLSKETPASARNWYMSKIFGESIITPVGTICCTAVIVLAFIAAALTLPGLM